MATLDEKIHKQIITVINTTIFKEKKKIFTFEGASLYPSEVHLMLVIKKGMDTNATEIAKLLGLTKGAISQTLSRLENKGIIRKTKDPQNKNELNLTLTPFGEQAYQVCMASEASMQIENEAYLSTLTQKEKETILNFLLHLDKAIGDLKLA